MPCLATARLFRAMCAAERDATLGAGGPVFAHGAKFFSHDLGWVAERVRDGRFCGRSADAYAHVVAFELPRADLAAFRRLNGHEWLLRAGASRPIRFGVAEVPPGEVEAARLRAAWGR